MGVLLVGTRIALKLSEGKARALTIDHWGWSEGQHHFTLGDGSHPYNHPVPFLVWALPQKYIFIKYTWASPVVYCANGFFSRLHQWAG